MNNEYIVRVIVVPKINEAMNLVETCRYMFLGKTVAPEDILLSKKFEETYKSLCDLLEVIDNRGKGGR